MSYRLKQILLAAGLLLLLGLACAWWFAAMERQWQIQRRSAPQTSGNPLLAATRWLESHHHEVTLQATLSDALRRPPRGVLLLGDSDGELGEEQAAALLRWVRAGNMLIMRPAQDEEYAQEEAAEADTGAVTAAPVASGVAASASTAASVAAASAAAAAGAETSAAASSAQASAVATSSPAAAAASSPVAAPAATRFDPISRHFGISLVSPPPRPAEKGRPCKCEDEPPVQVTLPGQPYPLLLDTAWKQLHATGKGPRPRYRDHGGTTLQVFAEGAGHVVLLAGTPFTNHTLGQQDHAELLLALTRLQAPRAPVVLVLNLDVPRWYQVLWQRFPAAILTLALALLLLLWAAVRRFGPLLPEAAGERRALIEHIDASGRWLWKLDGGREQLLQAARIPVLALLERRLPGLARLPDARLRQVAEACGLSAAQVRYALQDPPARLPGEFTRQLQLLQGLRKHYER